MTDTEDVECDLIEVLLPSNPFIEKFHSLSQKDKVNVIELGLSLYERGMDKIQFLQNKEWEEKITKIQESHNIEVESIESKLQREKELYKQVLENHQREKKEISDNILSNESIKYSSIIDGLKEKIRENEEILHQKSRDLNNIYGELTEKYEKKIDEIRENCDKRIDESNRITNDYRDKYEKSMLSTHNSTIKGQEGEEFTYHQLNCLFPKADITDCHKETARGDFILQDDNLTMMLEIKNYNTNVNKTEITKFYRDVKSESNSDIQCAVLISLKTGIANKPDFSLEFVNKKPVVFLHKLQNNMQHLKIIVQFFKLIMCHDVIDADNSEKVAALKEILSTSKRNFNRQKKRIDKYYKEQMEDIVSIESSMQQIFSIISLK